MAPRYEHLDGNEPKAKLASKCDPCKSLNESELAKLEFSRLAKL